MRHKSAMLDVEAGALLLPFWVCDYTLQGGDYRAFVNGFSGQVGGTSHVDSFRAEAASGAITLPCHILDDHRDSEIGVTSVQRLLALASVRPPMVWAVELQIGTFRLRAQRWQ